MASDFGMISHGPQGSILVKRRCGLLNPSFLQRLACVWVEAKGLKVRGQDMCGDQVRVQQRVTVQHKDTPLFSPTALGRFFTTIIVEMLWVQGIRNVIGILLACSFTFFLISDTSYEVSENPLILKSMHKWHCFLFPYHLVPPPPRLLCCFPSLINTLIMEPPFTPLDHISPDCLPRPPNSCVTYCCVYICDHCLLFPRQCTPIPLLCASSPTQTSSLSVSSPVWRHNSNLNHSKP